MNDRKLPALMQATNDATMQNIFSATRFHDTDAAQYSWTRVQHDILKYTPGKRCVIAYHLRSQENAGHAAVMIGKLYRHDRGEKIFKNLRQLWRAALRTSFAMPEPLAYLPELGMVIQSVAPGKPLANFSPDDDLPRAVRLVAQNLAALHSLPVVCGEKKMMADHIKKYCHPGPEFLMHDCREMAPVIEEILAGLLGNENLQNIPLCPVHGDLGLTQIFVMPDRAFFIDFDGFCLSHAALDVSNFLAALQTHFAQRFEELAGIFLKAYFARQTHVKLSGLSLYHALIALRRAMIGWRLKAHRDWRLQVRHALETSARWLLWGKIEEGSERIEASETI